ncbi:MAG: dTDP-4-dehydrorhamnose 3,5-epimerase [Flavobacteriaceae bacterium]|nr:dTDP-4-dehydrorhamnose 3,5-epimerase [Flavobacteriaceae bacterium]
MMKIQQTTLEGCLILEPKVFRDHRGYFFESFNQADFQKITGLDTHFIQDNQSFSNYGTVRGLHYQTGVWAQSKLIRVLSGEILDVALDICPGSKTFGQHFSLVLSAENFLQFYIPKGFAHGFSVLSASATIAYKCDQFYHQASEKGIRYNDRSLEIDWKIPAGKMIVSDKDLSLPGFENILK